MTIPPFGYVKTADTKKLKTYESMGKRKMKLIAYIHFSIAIGMGIYLCINNSYILASINFATGIIVLNYINKLKLLEFFTVLAKEMNNKEMEEIIKRLSPKK